MKQEPVAWMAYVYAKDSLFGTVKIPNLYLTKPPLHMYDEIVELYTAPKQLSDEEIVNLYESLEYKNATSNEKYDAIQFARAILKKASEK